MTSPNKLPKRHDNGEIRGDQKRKRRRELKEENLKVARLHHPKVFSLCSAPSQKAEKIDGAGLEASRS